MDSRESPQTFDQVIGQSAAVARLQSALTRGRVAHAILLCGPDGSGKRTLANLFARALLCESDEKPCNHCSPCRKALSGNHADLHVIIPKEEGAKGGPERALSPGTPRLKRKSLGVEEARAIARIIDVRPYEGGHAVVVIDSAQELTPAAQNALLKTLEEPPAHVVFLLLAESTAALLPTVLSRCAMVKLARLNGADVRRVLSSRGYTDTERTAEAAAMADGLPGRALELLADEGFWALRERALQTLQTLTTTGRLAEAMRFLQDNRAGWPRVLDIWERALRDALVARSGARTPPLGGQTPAALRALDEHKLEDMLLSLSAAHKAMDGNGIYTVVMDHLLIELSGGIK